MKRLARWFSAGTSREHSPPAPRLTEPRLPIALDDAGYLADPHGVDDWLRRNAPVAPVAGGGYLLTRHADVVAALTDPRLGNTPSRFAVLHPRQAGRHLAAAMATRLPPFLDMPAHRLPRQALVRAYHDTLKASGMGLGDIAEGVVAALPRGQTFDLIEAAATPMACRSIAAFVGVQVPLDTLRPATAAFFQMFAPITDAATFAEGAGRLALMRDVLGQALMMRRAAPEADLISHLLAFKAEHPDLTDDHIVDAAFLVLADGIENIVAGTALALRTLLSQPGAVDDLRAGTPPDPLIREALRLDTPALTVPRIAREALTLHGIHIAVDLPVFLHLASAARDPVAVDEADKFRPDRTGAVPLMFGLGRHRCIGESLGLAQIGALVQALVRAGVCDAGTPFSYHARFGHRWPRHMAVSLPRTAG